MQDYMELMRCEIPEGVTEHWRVERFAVEKRDKEISLMRSITSGRHVTAGTYTRLIRRDSSCLMGPVMSDTPDELRDHFRPFCEAEGVCLVNGLGLGCIVKGMLEKRNDAGNYAVKKVVVIEIDKEVIELVGTHLNKRYGDRLEIRCADALKYKPPKNERYNVVWHDIWPTICTDNLESMTKLHRKYGRRCDWQGSWQRSFLKRRYMKEKKEENMWRSASRRLFRW